MSTRILISTLALLIYGSAFSQTPYLDSLLSLAESNDTIKLEWLKAKSRSFVFGRLDSTMYYGNKVISLAQELNQPESEIEGLAAMGLSLNAFGNASQSLSLVLRGINLADKHGYAFRKAYALVGLGNLYRAGKEYTKAIDAYKESISILDSMGNGFGLSQVRMAEAFMEMNELDSAWFHCNQANEMNRLSGNSHALGLYMAGRIQHEMGNNDEALDYLYQGLSLNNAGYAFDINHALAEVYLQIDQIDSGIYYTNKALAIAQETGFYSQIIETNILLSTIYENIDLSKSLYHSRMAKIYTDSLHDINRLVAYNNLFDFDQQERLHELESAQISYSNQVQRLWLSIISGALISVAILALVLFRNNKNRQKANQVLQEQKEEIQTTLEQLKSTQTQLIHSEKMASLGELTAGIAHEIQNPLNFVNNFSEVNKELIEEVLAERSKEKGVRDESLEEELLNDIKTNEEKISHHGKRAEGIVKSMLQHSRTSSGEKEDIDINVLADEYLRLAYHGMRAKEKSFNVELVTDFDKSVGTIKAVGQDIGRVLLNLTTNAFHALAEKKSRENEEFKPELQLVTKKENDQMVITISDNGTGIPKEIVSKIFQPFFSTKGTGKGTGLGLSLSYDIITKGHGGTIEVESEEGEGTKFRIKLPYSLK